MNNYKYIAAVWVINSLLSLCSCNFVNQNPSPEFVIDMPEASKPINDAQLLTEFEKEASSLYKQNGGVDADTYKEQLSRKQWQIETLSPNQQLFSGALFYNKFKTGVLMMGKMYHCGHCPKEHISAASAFVISHEGICATNYHVFKSYDPSKPNEYITFFVMDAEQNVYPVTEVLAASKQDDLAIFKIDMQGKKLTPLNLGVEQPIGSDIHLISHPDNRFYTYTQGHINRTYFKPGTTKIRQSISAEFAKGSSGAPVMDNYGNVVGIVAGTQNIYYDQEGKIYQSTIKEMIPVSRLKELIK